MGRGLSISTSAYLTTIIRLAYGLLGDSDLNVKDGALCVILSVEMVRCLCN